MTVQGVAAPVELFLQGDHAGSRAVAWSLWASEPHGTKGNVLPVARAGAFADSWTSRSRVVARSRGLSAVTGNFCNPVPVNS